MIVFDASSSMAMLDTGRRRIDIARNAIAKVLPEITRYRATGLVIYSGGGGPHCTDVRLEVAPRLGNTRNILSALGKVQPSGATPLSNAVELAAETLAQLGSPGIVVLITDGLENCFRDACQLAQELKRARTNVRVHVIGFYMDNEPSEPVACLSNATGGTFVHANSAESLQMALRRILGCNRIAGTYSSPRQAASIRPLKPKFGTIVRRPR
ncbi:MAG: vWA domain-containing protein [Hyphomicrobiaceae bacterium]